MLLVRYCLENIVKKTVLFTYIFVQLLISISSALLPIINGQFIDSIMFTRSDTIIYRFIIVIIIFFILQLILTYLLQMLAVSLSTNFIFSIQSKFVMKIQHIPTSKSNMIDDKITTQEIIYDSQALSSFLLESCTIVPSNIAIFLFSITTLFSLNYTIALLILLFFIIYLLYNSVVKPILEKKQLAVKNIQSLFFSKLQEQIGMIKIIKIFNLHKYMTQQFFDSYKKYQSSLFQLKKSGYLFFVGDSIFSTLIQIFIFLISGFAIINGEMTVGQFTMILAYFSMMINSSKFISTFTTQYSDANSSFLRIKKYQQLESEKQGHQTIDSIQNITLENVSFSHEVNNDYTVINNFNYSFELGKIYCVMGYNGSGKSTLLEIIMGLYQDKITGKISYNNIDLNKLNKFHLYSNIISFLPQFSILFNTDFKNNIYLDQKDSNVNVLPFLKSFRIEELAYRKTSLTDKDQFSGGEIQKISLIRSLIRKNSILILDEPTNQLDFESKKALLRLLKKEKKNKIIIISSHDYEIEQLSDEVIEL